MFSNSKWNPNIQEKLETIITEGQNQNLIAIFDFDNTIICRDIGEPVMAVLANQNRLVREKVSAGLGDGSFYNSTKKVENLPNDTSIYSHYEEYLKWADSQHNATKHYADAYGWLLKIKAGLTPLDIVTTTKQIMQQDLQSYVESNTTPHYRLVANTPFYKPFLYNDMVQLICQLINTGYRVYIVSASPVWTVRWMVQNILNPNLITNGACKALELDAVFGMSCLLSDQDGNIFSDRDLIAKNTNYLNLQPAALSTFTITDQLFYPLPCFNGKREVIEKYLSESPYIVAGDSENDLAMLTIAKYKLWISRTDRLKTYEKIADYSISHVPDSWLFQLTDCGIEPGFIVDQPNSRLSAQTF